MRPETLQTARVGCDSRTALFNGLPQFLQLLLKILAIDKINFDYKITQFNPRQTA